MSIERKELKRVEFRSRLFAVVLDWSRGSEVVRLNGDFSLPFRSREEIDELVELLQTAQKERW